MQNIEIPIWPYVYGGPSGSGNIRSLPEDFIVKEILSFEPSGTGEHAFLQIEKRAKIPNMSPDNWLDSLMSGNAMSVMPG
jgi:Uncharacterized conserved protein